MPPYLSIPLILLGACLFLFVLYLLSVMPGARRDMSAFTRWHYAHRGLHDGDLPENSLAAFRAACRAGYGIELDVQLSRDGVAMVFHDERLGRMCGVDGRLSDYTAKELGAMALGGRAEHTIPTFADVLKEVGGRVPLLVEIKGYRNVTAVCEAAAALLDAYEGAYIVESFTPVAVHWFKKHRPQVLRGQLSARLWRKGHRNAGNLIVQALCSNFLSRPDFIAYCWQDRGLLSFRLATRLFSAWAMAWTVRSEGEQKACTAAFDAIIFEHYLPEGKGETL